MAKTSEAVLAELRAEAREFFDGYGEQPSQPSAASAPRTPRERFYDFVHGGKLGAHWAGAAACEPIAERALRDAGSIVSQERIRKLASRLHPLIRKIESAIADLGGAEGFNPANEWPIVELAGMLAYDRLALDGLRALPCSSKFANEVAEHEAHAMERWQAHAAGNAADLWRIWSLSEAESAPDVIAAAPRLIAFAAAKIWANELADDFAAARGQPAICGLPSALNLVRCRRRDAQIDVATNEVAIALEGRHEGVLRPSHTIPQITSDVAARLAGGLAGAHMRPMLGHILRKAQSQFVNGDRSGQVIYHHGFEGLCDAMGDTPTKDRCNQLRHACDALSCLHIKCSAGYGGVFGYWHHRAGRKHPAKLKIHLMGPLSPGYGEELRNVSSKWRKLVPVIVDLPAYVGRANDHGAQAVLVDRLVLYMREHAMEISSDGYIIIGAGPWRTLLDESGVSRRTGDDLLSTWTRDHGGRPALLEASGSDRYRLADHHREAREMLIDAGRMERDGRASGRKSARRRRERG